MIDWNKSAKLNNTTVKKLQMKFEKFPKSNKNIVAICNICRRVKKIKKYQYRDLCHSCAAKQKQKQKLSEPKFVKEENRFILNTGIDRILTIEKFGYDPVDLKDKSARKVIRFCKICGEVKEINFSQYHNLCHSCKLKSKETHIKMSESRKIFFQNNPGINSGENNSMYGRFGDKNPNWKGGIAHNRDHILSESQCIKLNLRFDGSEGHHLTSSVMVYIPKYIHRSVWHNMKNGLRMEEINKVAYNYLRGDI